MAPRSRLLLLVRSYAHACSSQGRRLHPGAPVPGKHKVRAYFKGGIEKKLAEQDLKIIEMEGDLNILDGRISGEAELYKLKEQKDAQNLECAIEEIKFSAMKGAAAFIGLSAVVASLMANMSRITEFVWNSGKNGPGKESD